MKKTRKLNLTLHWQLRKRNKTREKKNFFELKRKNKFSFVVFSFYYPFVFNDLKFFFRSFPRFSPTNFLLFRKVLFYSQFSQTFIVCVVFYWRYLLLINRSSFSFFVSILPFDILSIVFLNSNYKYLKKVIHCH